MKAETLCILVRISEWEPEYGDEAWIIANEDRETDSKAGDDVAGNSNVERMLRVLSDVPVTYCKRLGDLYAAFIFAVSKPQIILKKSPVTQACHSEKPIPGILKETRRR